MHFAYLVFIVSGLAGIFFSQTIHRIHARMPGPHRHVPTSPHSVVAVRVIGAVFLLVGSIGLGLWLAGRRE